MKPTVEQMMYFLEKQTKAFEIERGKMKDEFQNIVRFFKLISSVKTLVSSINK